MMMPVPVIIPQPTTEEAAERLERTLDRNLAIMSTVVGMAGSAIVIAFAGIWIGLAIMAVVIVLSLGVAWLMDRYDIEMSTVIMTLMFLVMLGFTVVGAILAFTPWP